MKYTNFLRLRKPDQDDFYDIADHNLNYDSLDDNIETAKMLNSESKKNFGLKGSAGTQRNALNKLGKAFTKQENIRLFKIAEAGDEIQLDSDPTPPNPFKQYDLGQGAVEKDGDLYYIYKNKRIRLRARSGSYSSVVADDTGRYDYIQAQYNAAGSNRKGYYLSCFDKQTQVMKFDNTIGFDDYFSGSILGVIEDEVVVRWGTGGNHIYRHKPDGSFSTIAQAPNNEYYGSDYFTSYYVLEQGVIKKKNKADNTEKVTHTWTDKKTDVRLHKEFGTLFIAKDREIKAILKNNDITVMTLPSDYTYDTKSYLAVCNGSADNVKGFYISVKRGRDKISERIFLVYNSESVLNFIINQKRKYTAIGIVKDTSADLFGVHLSGGISNYYKIELNDLVQLEWSV